MGHPAFVGFSVVPLGLSGWVCDPQDFVLG
jgi:hypothetical protein